MWAHCQPQRIRKEHRVGATLKPVLRLRAGCVSVGTETRTHMRIAYLSTHYPYVSHTFIQGEIIALEARGHAVTPIALNAPSQEDVLSDHDRREQSRALHLKALPAGRIFSVLLGTFIRHPIAMLRSMQTAISLGGTDVRLAAKAVLQLMEGILVWDHCTKAGITRIHSHFGQAPASVALLATRFGNAVGHNRWTWSMTIHGWHEFATEDTSQLKRKIHAADLVVCVSDFTRSQLMRLSRPADWSKIKTIRCGVDLREFRMTADECEKKSEPVVVTTARLSPEKGHVILIGAMAQLRGEGLVLRAVFIGDGPFRNQLTKAAHAAGVDDLIEFAGALPPSAVIDRLSTADAFCLPSFAEGLPVSLMEAMAVGVPVVTTYVAGTPELVVNDVSGWIVPPGNVGRLAEALREATTGDRRRAMVDGARAAIEHAHDREANIVEFEHLLEACHGTSNAG